MTRNLLLGPPTVGGICLVFMLTTTILDNLADNIRDEVKEGATYDRDDPLRDTEALCLRESLQRPLSNLEAEESGGIGGF